MPTSHPGPPVLEDAHPAKRQRHSSADPVPPPSPPANEQSPPPPTDHTDAAPYARSSQHSHPAKAGHSSNFRNVSACNRCRLRKNRCDQKLPSCNSCAKAGVACVGYDPITKKQIPRSYVFYLETRVEQLENILLENNIPFPPAEDLEVCSRTGSGPRTGVSATEAAASEGSDSSKRNVGGAPSQQPQTDQRDSKGPGMPNIVSSTKPRSLASTSGVSFARVVLAAVQYSVSDQASNPDRLSGARVPGGASTSMRESFFGLHTKPTIRPAVFPSEELGRKLVDLYFQHNNPQIPILHRGEFMEIFERVYSMNTDDRPPRELYLLNMVFAIGCGVVVDDAPRPDGQGGKAPMDDAQSKSVQAEPEGYHASAIVHLETCLSNSGGGLEVLQAVLLLANFALLRPVPPGLWYIVGVAMRLAVDMGLHSEDGSDISQVKEEPGESTSLSDLQPSDKGKRLYLRDMRRRLWWCTYALDRLVSASVGRPFGISDQVITTELPSSADDKYITKAGIFTPDPQEPSYKSVAFHYLRLRFLQSEILQVLMYKQTQLARSTGQSVNIPDMHIRLPSPFLVNFDSFRSWRMDIDKRLYEWRMMAPTKEQTGVAFSTEFLELNYWQAIILLYRNSLSVPPMFEGEYNTSKEVNSPDGYPGELDEDEDRIYLKVAEAGQRILRLYRQLHVNGLVSYTYLSTHHLFMAGIAYLYAIWHSSIVRSRLSMDEVDFTILAAKSVFTDMIERCPPAESCRDAFDRTAKATVKMANVNGGFGSQARRKRKTNEQQQGGPSPMDWRSSSGSPSTGSGGSGQASSRAFGFDMDALTSPALSAGAGENSLSPRLPRAAGGSNSKSFGDTFGGMQSRQAQSLSPSDGSGGAPGRGASPIDPALLTPNIGQRMGQQRGGPFMSQQHQQGSFPAGSTEYPDLQSMEFLQALRNPSGDLGSLDPLGFGLSWDAGINQELGEGQQMNPFDGFFFGGQPGHGGGT